MSTISDLLASIATFTNAVNTALKNVTAINSIKLENKTLAEINADIDVRIQEGLDSETTGIIDAIDAAYTELTGNPPPQ